MVLAISGLTAVGLVASPTASSRPGEKPVITGDAIVGETLTSSSVGEDGLYRWQRCNPSTAACADGSANDVDWVDILGATGHNLRTYTVTQADVGHLIRVLAKDNSLGTQFAASDGVGPVPGPPAEEIVPQHGITVEADLVEGTAGFKPRGQSGFTPVGKDTLIPIGSIITTRNAVIRVTAATGAFGNTTEDESIQAYGGDFRIKQNPAANSPAVLKLVGKLRCGGPPADTARAGASGAEAVASGRRRRRRLWGSGRGSYATAGGGGTGSVVGTTWFTKDTCRGTYFRVSKEPGPHGIEVDAKGKKKDIFLGPGESYFAER